VIFVYDIMKTGNNVEVSNLSDYRLHLQNLIFTFLMHRLMMVFWISKCIHIAGFMPL